MRPEVRANADQLLWYGAAKRRARVRCTAVGIGLECPRPTLTASSLAVKRRAECAQTCVGILCFFFKCF